MPQRELDDIRDLDDITSSHHGGNRCSEEANVTVAPYKSTQRFLVLYTMYKYTDADFRGGISCDETERVTGLKHQSCGARVTELKADGLITVNGYTKTRSGCRCASYVVTPEVYRAMKELDAKKAQR